jgi:hypothetical protein
MHEIIWTNHDRAACEGNWQAKMPYLVRPLLFLSETPNEYSFTHFINKCFSNCFKFAKAFDPYSL